MCLAYSCISPISPDALMFGPARAMRKGRSMPCKRAGIDLSRTDNRGSNTLGSCIWFGSGLYIPIHVVVASFEAFGWSKLWSTSLCVFLAHVSLVVFFTENLHT